jgi:hypothetical protein
MGEQSAAYFLRRERAERSAAATAASAAVRSVHLEMAERYAAEAEQCRRDARGYQGRPEQQFLLHVARSFDGLAGRGIDVETSHGASGERTL